MNRGRRRFEGEGLHLSDIVTLADHLTATADRTPEAAALIWQDRTISYGELDRRVHRAADGLVRRGVDVGDRVGLVAGNTPHFVEAFLAILRAGGLVVPVNTGLAADEIVAILADARISGLVVAESEVEVLWPVRDGVESIEFVVMTGADRTIEGVDATWRELTGSQVEDRAEGAGDASARSSGGDDLAALVYTSGTTGRPRGAMLTHANLAANQKQALSTRLSMRADDIVLAVLPLFHIYAMNVGLGGAIRTGASLVLVERFDPVRALDVVRRRDVSVVLGAPPMYVAWLNTPNIERVDLSGIRVAVSGAAPLPPGVFTRFRDELGVTIWEGYGLTEAAPAVTSNAAGDTAKPGSVGPPLPGVELRIVAEDGREVTRGDPGEIWVRGDNVFAGYWNDPDSTERALTGDGWLRTGDVGILDDDGYLRVVDRLTDLIIVSGFNVYPREIERVLEAHPKVVRAAVVGAPHPYRGEAVKAFVVRRDAASPAAGGEVTEDEIVSWCARRLAGFKCPDTVEFVDGLPHTATGKVKRRELGDGGALDSTSIVE